MEKPGEKKSNLINQGSPIKMGLRKGGQSFLLGNNKKTSSLPTTDKPGTRCTHNQLTQIQ
jgi:hypothetical protein